MALTTAALHRRSERGRPSLRWRRATARLSVWETPALLVVTLLSLLPGGGCVDAGADHLLLDRYFSASRLLDRTELARFATVAFEPGRDGIVTRFAVVFASEASAPAVLAEADVVTSRIVELSLADDEALESLLPSRVIVTTRHVGVDATVRAPSGVLLPRRLDVTVQRAEASDPPRHRGRWIVTAVTERR